MKHISIIIFSFLICNLSIAQHSDRFLELVKDLRKIGSEVDTTYYKNGKIWWIICWTTYEYNSEEFSTATGKLVQYHKNGQVADESCLGKYGNILSGKGFDRNGNKTVEFVTTEIDSEAKSFATARIAN